MGRPPKYAYPVDKQCERCPNTFIARNATQMRRNRLCKACISAAIRKARKKKPVEQRRGAIIRCAVCGKEVWKNTSRIRRVSQPMCSLQCNGKARGAEWGKHAHKARAAWSPEAEARHRQRMAGEKNPFWKGGVMGFHRRGNYQYKIKMVRCPEEFAAMARSSGCVPEYRLIVARIIGRALLRTECVHHVNGNPTDNRPQNLMLFENNSAHKRFEAHGAPEPLWSGERAASESNVRSDPRELSGCDAGNAR